MFQEKFLGSNYKKPILGLSIEVDWVYPLVNFSSDF